MVGGDGWERYPFGHNFKEGDRMKFPTDDLSPDDIEKALKALDERENGRKIFRIFPKVRCSGCGIFRTEIGDNLCKTCWHREHGSQEDWREEQ